VASLKQRVARCLVAAIAALHATLVQAENRTYDGTGNNLSFSFYGSAGTPFIRRGDEQLYTKEYGDQYGRMLFDSERTNARTLSNELAAQTTSIPNSRGLSNYLWAWGQFLDHDMDLTSTSHGVLANGSGNIAVLQANDPLASPVGQPQAYIAMTRSNFVIDQPREQINDVTSYIDGSQIYGSSATRAAALRTGGGTGAKLLTSANNLLPYNTAGLANQNNGPTPANQLFLAGDIRANENLLLTSMQTVFMREHNRLVDLIAVQQPALNAEAQYQLARKIVGAEVQAITYKEFLPALLGSAAPTVQGYSYSSSEEATITNSFAHAAFRFGHSALTSNVALANSAGVQTGTMTLGAISSTPNTLTNNPSLMNDLLRGAAIQRSEEIDLKHVSAIRNVMFGPPGSGGTDLAAIDIQRGRDHGLPDYNTLRDAYGLPKFTSFSQITSDTATRQALSSMYGGDFNNIDPFVGGLAEDHVAGSSLGPFFQAIIKAQFERSRDGDRLFYRNNAAGLYTNGVLNAQVASLVNLNTVSLASIIQMNTGITGLQSNLFFTAIAGDFNHDGYVNTADLTMWRAAFAQGTMTGNDYLTWQRNQGAVAPWVAAASVNVSAVPEPSTLALAVLLAVGAVRRKRRAC
jgi:peroxidase